jgi:hypothetical protein
MIKVSKQAIFEKAKRLPISYLQDCEASSVPEGEDYWVFSVSAYKSLLFKYRGYVVSEADTFREGDIISGCCDRADQY